MGARKPAVARPERHPADGGGAEVRRTENFDTSPWQREPPPGLDRTPTYEETRNPAWEAYHRARIQKALAPELHEAQHKLWAHFFDGPAANTRSKKAAQQPQQRG